MGFGVRDLGVVAAARSNSWLGFANGLDLRWLGLQDLDNWIASSFGVSSAWIPECVAPGFAILGWRRRTELAAADSLSSGGFNWPGFIDQAGCRFHWDQ